MEKIPSFKKNHDTLKTGLYVSTLQQGVTTFDLRFKKPNGGDYISPKACHTIEHLIATFLRNGAYKDDIIYFGPMGCRTGFYLLTVNLNFNTVLDELLRVFALGAAAEEIPGNKKAECGNYLEHDLADAKCECAEYLKVLSEVKRHD